MKPEELQAIRDRWGKATPGPWWAVEDIIRPYGRPAEMAICSFEIRKNHGVDYRNEQIAIGHAPADIAALLAEVERLNARIERMKSEACPPVHCMDGIKCSECWNNWLATVCDAKREWEARNG